MTTPGSHSIAGVYPMLLDETCFFLAIDFDKQGWNDDTRVFIETCERMNIPAVLERSRSGRGGHVWCFLPKPFQRLWLADSVRTS
jgi:hypothetical protein